MVDRPMNGTACWVDLSTPDTEASVSFYSELLGWEVSTMASPMGDYFVASVGGREVGGMMEHPPELRGGPARWTVFFLVDDLEEVVSRVSAAGGRVVQPSFAIPGGAHVAVVSDASGAMFALITGGPEPGAYLSTDIGAVSWLELMTRSPAAAEQFYNAVFGWTAASADVGGVVYTTFEIAGQGAAGMIATPPTVPPDAPDSWSVYFNVADCVAAQERASALGGEVLLPATPTPMGPFAVLADPQGAVFQVMQVTGTHAAGAGEGP